MLKSSTFPKIFLMLVLVIVLTAFSSEKTVQTQSPAPSDDDVNQVASQLFCPICENMSLDVCPIEACHQWRELIRDQLSEGWTEPEIKEYFVAQYGDRVLGEPPRRGLNWTLYLAPPIVILLGAVLFISKMKSTSQGESIPEVERPLDPYLEQVEHDLRKLD